MKISYMSDLHFEFNKLDANDLMPEPGDVLICAGDIDVWSVNGSHMFEWMDSLPFKHILYTPGNHEFYNGAIEPIKGEMTMCLENYPNISMLWNNKIEIDGQVFLGTPLWSNFNNEDSFCMETARRFINDFRITQFNEEMHWSPTLMIPEYEKAIIFLEENIITGDEIVFTHWAPSFLSGDEQFAGEVLNGYFTNPLDRFIERLAPRYWIHGHCHNNSDYMIDNTHVLANPKGYPGENKDFNINAYFEV